MTVPILWLGLALGWGLCCGLGYRLWQAQKKQQRLDETNQIAQQTIQQAQTALQTAQSQLTAITKIVHEAILFVNTDLTLNGASEKAQILFGKFNPTAGTVPVRSYTQSLEIEVFLRDTEQSALQNEVLEQQIQRIGHVYQGRAVRYANGIALSLSDVSELQRLSRMRRDFIANLSHELRTPLTTISLLLDGFDSHLQPLTAEQRQLLGRIRNETRELQQMAQEVLDLAQIESGRALFRLRKVSLAQMLFAQIERLKPLAENRALQIEAHLPENLQVLADEEQVGRAFGNLLHNAIKFSGHSGKVSIFTCPIGEEVQISVQDQGPGISARELTRVFERFYKADRTRSSGGTGLGLAIAKHVIEEGHGGKIWAESSGQANAGSTFHFTLPIA
jgi:two-component system phosphate regulon sensor histidine kinase PhoR